MTKEKYELMQNLCDNFVVVRDLTTDEIIILEKDKLEATQELIETLEDASSAQAISKLSSVIKPMSLQLWKTIVNEEGGGGAGGAGCGGMAAGGPGGGMAAGPSAGSVGGLGTAPCPALGNVTAATVNGIPVAGESQKKKKKKKKIEEDFTQDKKDITALVTEKLDELGFEFANTKEIVYKKQSLYKYLIKFDNLKGQLKFKILDGDQARLDTSWKLETVEDVDNIFALIAMHLDQENK